MAVADWLDRRPRGTDDPLLKVGLPLLLFVALIVAWEIGVDVTNTPSIVLPAPTEIWAAFLEGWPGLLESMGVTAVTALGGLSIGVMIGFPLAYGLVRSRVLGSVLLPYIVGLRIAPLVAIAPLFVVWLGNGIWVRVLLVSTMTVFPVTIASYDGLRSVPRPYLDLAASVQAPQWVVFARIRVRAALPSVFAGLKLAGALSVIGAVVAEFITLESGIGYRVFAASDAIRTPEMFAALGCLSVLGMVFFAVPAVLEGRLRAEPV